MGEKEAIKRTLLKATLPKYYIKYYNESDDDLDTVIDKILSDIDSNQILNKEDKEIVYQQFLKELENLQVYNSDEEVLQGFIKESQKASSSWNNVQKAKEIMKKLSS